MEKRRYIKQEWRKNWKYLQEKLPITTGWITDGVSDDITNKEVTEEIMGLLDKAREEGFIKGVKECTEKLSKSSYEVNLQREYDRGYIEGRSFRDKWREITLYAGMVRALIRVYKWCKDEGVHEFTRKDIKNKILRNENDVARWGDWILFGAGMVYKPKGKGSWGLNMERVDQFLSGELEIPIRIAKKGKEVTIISTASIQNIPNLMDLLDEDLRYVVKYYSKPTNLFSR